MKVGQILCPKKIAHNKSKNNSQQDLQLDHGKGHTLAQNYWNQPSCLVFVQQFLNIQQGKDDQLPVFFTRIKNHM